MKDITVPYDGFRALGLIHSHYNSCLHRCWTLQVLSRLLSGMKDRVNNRVLKDYAKFMAERKAGRV